MKLTFEQIKSVTKGALTVRQEEDGVSFHRFTPTQAEYLGGVKEMFSAGCKATTGVRLDFETDAKTLSFTASHGKKFDLWVDGVLREQKISDQTPQTLQLTDPLGFPKESVRVTLWLPSHERGVLSSVELDDGSSIKPTVRQRKILFLGDSITQGWDAKFDSLAFVPRVAAYFDADFVCQGLGGYFYDEKSLEKLSFEPDTVVVAYGTNDWDRCKSQNEFQDAVRAYYKKFHALYGNKKVYVVTPIWRGHHVHNPPEKLAGRFEELIAFIKETAEGCGYTVIDGLSLVPPCADFFIPDLLHPNDLGFASYAENLIREMERK